MNLIKSLFKNIINLFKNNSPVVNPEGFGTFYGVFVPNVTMMFGVILFMRLGVVLGNTGMWEFCTILAVSALVMIITSLSIAMIVTNMKVGGGGIYYLLSRSLGMEIGGAIGIALALAQIITVSLCISGFAYSVSSFLGDTFPALSFTMIEVATLVLLALLSFTSADLALKTQLLVFMALMVGVGSVFFSKETSAVTITETENLFPQGLSFWAAFGLFYPALTGIEAGMGISGALKRPSRSLWMGSLLSLSFVAVVYFLMATFLALNVPGEQLRNSPMILIQISRVPKIIYMSIWAATLSSALGALVGGPRMFQSIAKDGVIPSIFGRTYGRYQEPRYALLLTFGISLVLMFFTTIDQILPIQAMICLIAYGTLNLVAGMSELIHSPRWRPTVRIPFWLSLGGGGLCLFLMFMINPMWSFISFFVVFGMYFSLRFMSLDVNFQDLRESIIFFFSRFALYHLSKMEEHAHHWHPQLLAFSNAPTSHRNMICLASSFTRRSGILTLATILPLPWEEQEELEHMKRVIEDYLAKLDVACLVEAQSYACPKEGIENLIKSYGLGSLQPNTVMLYLSEEENIDDLIDTIEVCKLYSKNLILFKDSDHAPLKLFKSAYQQRKRIDIWWDNEYTSSFQLILSFIHTLTSGVVWKYAHTNLRGVFRTESAKQHLKEYFQEFTKNSRVRLKSRLYVEPDVEDPLDVLKDYSDHSDLVMLPLRPIEEDREEYKTYFESLLQKLPNDTPFVMITSYDSLDHSEIYTEQNPPG